MPCYALEILLKYWSQGKVERRSYSPSDSSQYFEIQDIMSGIIGSWQLIDGQLFLLKGFPGDNHLGTTWSLSRT